MKKAKTREERQAAARKSRERKSQSSPRRRTQRDWRAYDEDDPDDAAWQTWESMGAKRSSHAAESRAQPAGPHPWRVTAVHMGRLEIERQGKSRSAHLGGTRLRGGPPVVGDRVAIEECAGGACRVVSIDERFSYLERQVDGSGPRTQTLAANVDVGWITLPAQADGSLRMGWVERLRIAYREGGITPWVVITKIDRLSPEALEALTIRCAELVDRGLPCFPTSALDGRGIDELAKAMQGSVVAVAGHSGVGKSSLLNALDSSAQRATGGVREHDDRGRHTTTAARMTAFREGWLIDTPGIRSLGLQERTIEEWLDHFPLLAQWASDCPKGCQHRQSDCAIQEQLAQESDSDTALRREWQSLIRILDN